MKILFNELLLFGTPVLAELPNSLIRKRFSGGHGEKVIHGKKTGKNSGQYASDDDFDMGTYVNVNHEVPDQLQLDDKSTPSHFIWIPLSNLGLVVKVDTNTGDILGTYQTSPSTHGLGDPSRTTVDHDGSVWVANRNNIYGGQGSIVHIGLLENNQCEERNGIPGIQTSTSNVSLDWTNEDGPRGVGTAEDECIVHYTQVHSLGTRHLSIDASNDVWVSGFDSSPRPWDLVKGGRYDNPSSGKIMRTEEGWEYGGYGGLMDKSGNIWSAGPLLRWDPEPAPGSLLNTSDHDSYGLCIDSKGNVWNTALYGNTIRKFSPDGLLIGQYAHGDENAQGCVVDRNDDVWVAHSKVVPSTTVGHLKNDGTYVGNVDVGEGPTGVAVDHNGKIWSSNYNSGTLSRINPDAGAKGEGGYKIGAVDLTVNLPAGSNPYNYGDMTGSTLISSSNTGTWGVKYKGVWKRLKWVSEEPDDSKLVVEARDGISGPWVTAENGVDLPLDPTTEYLEVQVIFTRASTGKSPILHELSVGVNSPLNCEHATANPDVILPREDKMVPIEIQNVDDPEGGVVAITVTGIFQDEPLELTRWGKFQAAGTGIGASVAKVRTKREDGENGRVYHISFTAENKRGDRCEGTVQVCIPLHRNKMARPNKPRKTPGTCKDGGPLFDSTKVSVGKKEKKGEKVRKNLFDSKYL